MPNIIFKKTSTTKITLTTIRSYNFSLSSIENYTHIYL